MSSASCSWWWLCYMSKCIIWTSVCAAKPMSSVSCSWLWLFYMSKCITKTNAGAAKPISCASCTLRLLWFMSKCIIWTSACVAKLRSSASCSWWWLCWVYLGSIKNRKSFNFCIGFCKKDWKAHYDVGFPELPNTFKSRATISFKNFLAVFVSYYFNCNWSMVLLTSLNLLQKQSWDTF